MRIKPFKALYPDMQMVTSPDAFFGVMKQEFPHYLKNSFFKRTSENCMFLYSITHNGFRSRGITTSTSVDDIKENKILKHENTIAFKEQQMLDLALQRNAMIKPVLLAHQFSERLSNIYDQIEKDELFMEIEFEEEEAIHRIWKITDSKTIKKIQAIFKEEFKVTYIADGHHRVSTGTLLNMTRNKSKAEFGDLLSIYFSFEDLQIFDYNRVVSILREISPTQLMAKLSKFFKITPINKLRKPKVKHEIVFALHNEYYSLFWRKPFLKSETKDKIVLDARLLNRYVFDEIMGITDVRNDGRISYIGGVQGVEGVRKLLLKSSQSVGFLLYPVQENELTTIADCGSTLPPKSTWFEPRIKNAIIIQEFE